MNSSPLPVLRFVRKVGPDGREFWTIGAPVCPGAPVKPPRRSVFSGKPCPSEIPDFLRTSDHSGMLPLPIFDGMGTPPVFGPVCPGAPVAKRTRQPIFAGRSDGFPLPIFDEKGTPSVFGRICPGAPVKPSVKRGRTESDDTFERGTRYYDAPTPPSPSVGPQKRIKLEGRNIQPGRIDNMTSGYGVLRVNTVVKDGKIVVTISGTPAFETEIYEVGLNRNGNPFVKSWSYSPRFYIGCSCKYVGGATVIDMKISEHRRYSKKI